MTVVYAGIDEVGYGPIFGPLVIARSVFVAEGPAPADPLPCLWRLMQQAVCRRHVDKRRRIAVNDSKNLYSPATGIACLERGVLAFLDLLGHKPRHLDALLHSMAWDEPSRCMCREWYLDGSGGPAMPIKADAKELDRARGRVARAAAKAGIRMEQASAAVVMEDRFNTLLDRLQTKGAVSWFFVSGHLRDIWAGYGRSCPRVVVDRQGGRSHYADLLQDSFPGAVVNRVKETWSRSTYLIHEGERTMEVTFQVGSEEQHLPVAMASMIAKYLRELLLMRFHRYWLERAPGVRPTYGYFGDGRRFLKEIEHLVLSMGIAPDHFVRRR